MSEDPGIEDGAGLGALNAFMENAPLEAHVVRRGFGVWGGLEEQEEGGEDRLDRKELEAGPDSVGEHVPILERTVGALRPGGIARGHNAGNAIDFPAEIH